MLRRVLSLILSFCLLFQQTGLAQGTLELNLANYLSGMSRNIAQERFRPLHLRYFSYDNLADNFRVLLDKGGLKQLDAFKAQEQTKTLLSYFLVGVALLDDMFWVNLRPDSEEQIIDPYLEKTDVGRIMLEADLQLKKDTAAMTSPATPEGRKYWDKLYKKAGELYGYDNVTIPTLTRPWIVPGEIIVRESKDSAYVYKAALKVMLEQDYLKDSASYNFKDERAQAMNEYSSQLIRELIIPKLTKEVNSGKRYAALRQVYYSLILSRWFKLRFSGKTGTYSSLINTRNLTNLTSQDPWSKTDYFKQYQKSFADGEYNIQEQVYTPTGQAIRSYFSGGIDVAASAINTQNGIILLNDNVGRLGDVIIGKAVVDPRNIRLKIDAAIPPEREESASSSPIYTQGYVPGKTTRVGLRDRNPNGGFAYNVSEKGEIIKAEREWRGEEDVATRNEQIVEVEREFTDNRTTEQIKAGLLELRRRHNPNQYNIDVNNGIELANVINRQAISIFSGSTLNNEEDIILAAILADNLGASTTAQEMQGWISYMRQNIKINDIEPFIQAVINTKEYVHAVGRNAGLAGDLELVNLVLRLWGINDPDIIEKQKQGYKIYIVAKNERIAQDATIGDVNSLLNDTRYSLISQAMASGIVEIIDSGSRIAGTDLTAATPAFRQLIRDARDGYAVLGLKGEENNFTVNLINAPHFRFFLAASKDSHIMTGLQWIKDSLIYDNGIPPAAYPVIINVPAGIEPAKDYFIIRQTRMEMKAFWEAKNILTTKNQNIDWGSIREALTSGPYRTLVEYVVDKYPKDAWHLIFEVYPGEIESGELSLNYNNYKKNRGVGEEVLSFFDFCKWLNAELKERLMSGVIENGLGGKYDTQVYKAIWQFNSNINNSRPHFRIAQFQRRQDGLEGHAIDPNTQQLTMRSVLVDLDNYSPENLNIDIVSAEEVNPGTALFYPDKILRQGVMDGELLPLISHTGGYFWPPALKTDGIDKFAPPDYQKVSKLNGIIDMKVRNDEISMLPVYNKAVVIVYNDEKIEFKRLSLGKGSIDVGGRAISWEGMDVNPANLGKVAVFTPMRVGSNDDIVSPDQNRNEAYGLFHGNRYQVGAGRFNIVIVGDGNANIYYNSVYSQPEGIIISLSEDGFMQRFGEELAAQIRSRNNTSLNGETETPGYTMMVTNMQMVVPQGIKYLYGGLTLVWDKNNSLPQNLRDSIANGQQLPRVQYQPAMEEIEQAVRANFQKEGWFNDISRVTQETQLQQILVTGPRSYWVKTNKYLMIVSAEGRQDTAMGLNFPEAVYFAYQKLFDLLVKNYNGDSQAARIEFKEQIRSLEILNWDGGSSVGLGSFIGVDDQNSRPEQMYVPILKRGPGPSNGKGAERPVPILVVHSLKGKQIGDISVPQATLREIWRDWGRTSSSSPVKEGTSVPAFVTLMVNKDLQGLNFKDVEKAIASGKMAIAEVSVDWAKKIKEVYPNDVYTIFISPLSEEQINERMQEKGQTREEVIFEEMAERQRERAVEKPTSEDKQFARAKAAIAEMSRQNEYDIVIISNQLKDLEIDNVRWDGEEGTKVVTEFMSVVDNARKAGKKLILYSGPSATGKSPLWNQVRQRYGEQFSRIVLYTTRPMRPGEEEGVDYYFRSVEQLTNFEKELKMRPFNENQLRSKIFMILYGLNWAYNTVLSEDEKRTIRQVEISHQLAGPGTDDLHYADEPEHVALSNAYNAAIAKRKLATDIKVTDIINWVKSDLERNLKGEEVNVILQSGQTVRIIGSIDRGIAERFGFVYENASSPVQSKPEKAGGIDFRALPMTIQPMGSFSGLNLKLPQLSQKALEQINIKEEIGQINTMVQAGILPSGERIKELIAACVQKKEINYQIDNLLLCLADIFKLEEENASESSQELKEALVIVDSQG